MASVKFSGNPIEYVSLLKLMEQMGIPGHAPLRQAVRDRVIKVWPELNGGGIQGGSPLIKENREMEISLEEQSALGHGFWGIYTSESVLDAVRLSILDLVKPGKVSISKWFNKKIAELPPITELVSSDEDEGMSDVTPDETKEEVTA